MKVTELSKYGDLIWDFSKENTMCGRSPASTRINFNRSFYTSNPTLLTQIKEYLWRRRCESSANKIPSWHSIHTYEQLLRTFCMEMIKSGVTDFRQLTKAKAHEVAKRLPKVLYSRNMLEQVRLLTGMYKLYPLTGLDIPKLIPKNCEQAKPISDADMRMLVTHALKLAEQVGAYNRVRISSNYKGSDARKLGVTGKYGLRAKHRLLSAAGAVLVLASVGMRSSELLSLKSDCLEFERGIWYINGTVHKFYGDGIPAKWQCGELGKRGVDLLRSLGGERLCTFTRQALLTALNDFAHAAGMKNPKKLHSHRFRRTFARKAILYASVEALKDHFKHKCIEMTDYYIGNDAELYETLITGKNSPEEFAKFLHEETDLNLSDL